MLKRYVRRSRRGALHWQQRGTRQPMITIERQTVQFIYDRIGQVNGRLKARELYTVLQLLEHALMKVNDS